METTRRELMGALAGLSAAGWISSAFAAGGPTLTDKPMVARVWHGRTGADKAQEYRQYLY